MGNNITYNCYLHNEDPVATKELPLEMRTLKVTRGAPKSFTYLNEQLVALFPVLLETNTNHSVLWQKMSNLWISILDDQGLEAALSYMDCGQTAYGPGYELHIHFIKADRESGAESISRFDEVGEPVAGEESPISDSKGLHDLPPEVIRDHIFEYLTGFDIYNIGQAGNRFLRGMSEEYVNRVVTILVAGGTDFNALMSRFEIKELSSAHLLKIHFDKDNEVTNVNTIVTDDLPTATSACFSCLCAGRAIVGGGGDSNDKDSSDVVEFERGIWRKLPSLNIPRSNAASAYLQNTLIVSGGYVSGVGKSDTIEMLHINATDNSPKFKMDVTDTLPVKVCSHTLTPFKGKLMLIGGRAGDTAMSGPVCPFDPVGSRAVYEGTMKNNHISWKQVGSLNKLRTGHITIPLNENALMVIGGADENSIEIYDGHTWKMGPTLPCNLEFARVAIDRANRAIITHGSLIIIFDPKAMKFKKLDGNLYKLKEDRISHVALLQ